MKYLTLAILAIMSLLLIGCGSIVKKPHVNKVKTAAIVSIYANGDVREAKGKGTILAWNPDLKQEVAMAFHDSYVDSFGKELGWEMASAQELINSEEYKETFRPELNTNSKSLNKLAGMMNKLADFSEKHTYFTPNNMHPIEISKESMKTISYAKGVRMDVKKSLANMANKLGVDAVVVVQIDYCYEPTSFSLKGLSKAHITAASTVRAVDKKGNMVVDMGDLRQCEYSTNRGKSKDDYGMMGGNIGTMVKDQEDLKEIFVQATEDNIKLTMKQLKKAMY